MNKERKREDESEKWVEVLCLVVNNIINDVNKNIISWEDAVTIIKNVAAQDVFHDEEENEK